MSDQTQLTEVSKRLDESTLDAGELRIGPKEANQLGLPPHSTEVACVHDGETFVTTWRGSDRTLGGDLFTDTLQLHGQVGGLVRLNPRNEEIELQFVEPGASTVFNSRWRDHRSASARPAPTTSVPSPPKRPRTSRQLRDDRFRIHDVSEYDWYDAVGVHRPTLDRFRSNIEEGGWDPRAVFDLRLRGEQLATVNDFEELLAVDLAKVDHMPHQEKTAAKVLASMRGRAILADEVGLGKTIEAGLILKELVVRGLARRTLVLCPATLREQWRDELHEKFDESFRVVFTGKEQMNGDRLIMSHALARRNVDHLAQERWDLVIVDEAHKLSGPNARKSHDLLRGIESSYRLFLTATPVQNDLLELYRLVELLRPGTFRSERDFKRTYIRNEDKRTPRDPTALRRLVSDVMVRTTREQAGIDRVSRHAVDVPITLSEAERKVYGLCTDVLRHVMTEGADSFRRRNFAQRLTTSPRALATSAGKVAGSHPDPRAREALGELAELCRDFPLTQRQHELMRLVKEWVADPGKAKVLVFTQTYETLHDLMRVLAEYGIDSEAYHGGLTAKARQAAIARFRNDCPVLVSTDAGAEGLNLQFANCVVNYDLPWNPMRIEQRIGRVHRVTQTRDVHVANFYARNTVDEHVYHLLHDKLRMFELLFGQVTTILGEIEGKGDLTFEGQVLDAYLAGDDSEMARRIDALGKTVDQAYQAAQKMVTTGTDVNAWMVDRSYRSDIKGQATELVPDVELRARQRQRDVESFVAEYLSAIGGTVAHRADDGSFLMADIPDDLSAELGGRHQLLLAFSPTGLDHHQEAELCAVGSEVFEEIVASLRDKGDLLAQVPRTPDLAPGPWFGAADGVEYVSREITGPARWAARANWRVHAGQSAADAVIVPADLGDVDDFETEQHREVDDAEALPFSAGEVDELLGWVVEDSVAEIEQHRSTAQEAADAAAQEDRDRQVAQLTSRIEEQEAKLPSAGPGAKADIEREIQKLRTAQKTLKQQRAADVEVRAELMSLRLTGQRTLVFWDTWRNRDGVEGHLEFEWDPWGGDEPEAYGDDDRLVTTVQVCRDGHAVDISHSRICPCCQECICEACGADGEMRTCRICEQYTCVRYMSRTSDLCQGCAGPARQPEHDRDGMVAWRLGNGRTLLIGERVALFDDVVIVPAMAKSTARPRVRAEARRRGLRLDMGVGSEPRPGPFTPPDGAVAVSIRDEDAWRVDPHGGGDITRQAAEQLPDAEHDGAVPETATAVGPLLRGLRNQVPPSPAPQLIQVPTQVTTWLEVDGGELWCVERVAAGANDPTVTRHRIDWEVVPASEEDGDLVATASCPLGDLALHRLHRSYVLSVGDDAWFISIEDDVDESAERIADELRHSVGLPLGTVIHVAPLTPVPASAPEPDGVVCTAFEVETEWSVVEPHSEATYIRRDDVDTFGWAPNAAVGRRLLAEHERPYRDLARSLDPLESARPVTLERRVVVAATWQGRSEATRQFEVDRGEPAWPVLDDLGVAAQHFGVDDLGHLHEPGHDWQCQSCSRWRCRACGPGGVLDLCGTCGQDACGDCRTAPPRTVPAARCERCGTRSCGDCSREVQIYQCVLCQRDVCATCWSGDVCGTCTRMEPADHDTVAALPTELVAHGLDVGVAEDDSVTVVGLAGATRRELAVIRDGHITRWFTLVPQDEATFRARLAYGAAAGLGDLGLSIDRSEAQPPVLPDPHVALVSEEGPLMCQWGIDRGDGRDPDAASDPVPLTGPSDAEALAAVLAAYDGSRVLPQPVPDKGTQEVLDLLAPSADAEARPPAVLHVRLLASGRRTDLTADGLRRVEFVGSSVDARPVPWRSDESDASDESRFDQTIIPIGQIRPHHTRRAVAGDVEVTMVGIGSHCLLSVRIGPDEQWYGIDDEPGFPATLALGGALGLSGPTRVGLLTLPDAAVPVTVTNGTLESRDMSPLASASGAEPSLENLSAAAERWTPSVTADEPSSTLPGDAASDQAGSGRIVRGAFVFPERLQRALLQRANVRPDPISDVGVRFTDVWATPGGTVSVTYDVHGGQTDGKVNAHDTLDEVNQGTADRSGHLVTDSSTCSYCETVTCRRCEDLTLPCALCAVPVCGRCRPSSSAPAPEDLGLCPACHQLDRLGWRDRRRHKAVLRGADSRRTVLVAPASGDGSAEGPKATVRVADDDGESRDEVALAQELADWLNSRAGKRVF